MTMRVAFLGLGVMGYPMAGHLKRAGHDVVVYNRTKERAERWAAEHGITQLVTTNDETNAPMLAVNERLGYTSSLRRVEYLRER